MENAFVTYPEIIYHIRHFLPLAYLVYSLKQKGFGYASKLILEYLNWLGKRVTLFFKPETVISEKSLRKTVKYDIPEIETDIEAMKPLRQGR